MRSFSSTPLPIISGSDGGDGPLPELHADPADQGALGPGDGAQGLHGRAGEEEDNVSIQGDPSARGPGSA